MALRRGVYQFILLVFFCAPLPAHPAWGIVVNRAGEVYYSDLETVWKIDRAGHVSVARAGVSGRHVHELSIDADDNIYGEDYDGTSTRVWKMAPSGAITSVAGPGV